MPDTTEVEQRRARLEATRADAKTLMGLVHHETVKDIVRLSARDLNEGELWLLRAERPEQRPWILAMVDHQIRLAASRLDYVTWALKTYGPDAMLFG